MADALDSTVWSQLPPELLELVLLRLPLETLFKFRTVCKRWRTLPLSPKFCNSATNPRSQQTYLLGVHKIGELQLCPVYNPVARRWSHLDLGFLQARFERFASERWQSFEEDRFGSSELKSASAHRGLLAVCTRVHESEQDAIFVCNPLTRACNLLPLIDELSWGLCLGVLIRVENHTYRVFATKHGKVENRFSQRLYMYDSVSSLWKTLPKCVRFSHDAVAGVFCGEVYYALYEDVDHDVVMALEDEAWVDSGVAIPHQGYIKKKLLEVDGRLVCVYSNRNFGSDKELVLSVMEVDFAAAAVRVVSRLEHVNLPDGGHQNWDAVAYRNSIILLTSGHYPNVFDLSADVPEWKRMESEEKLPKLLVPFTFDLRASVD